ALPDPVWEPPEPGTFITFPSEQEARTTASAATPTKMRSDFILGPPVTLSLYFDECNNLSPFFLLVHPIYGSVKVNQSWSDDGRNQLTAVPTFTDDPFPGACPE